MRWGRRVSRQHRRGITGSGARSTGRSSRNGISNSGQPPPVTFAGRVPDGTGMLLAPISSCDGDRSRAGTADEPRTAALPGSVVDGRGTAMRYSDDGYHLRVEIN